jgi:hypothetical protein
MVPLLICTFIQRDPFLYQVSSKSHKGFRRSCKEKAFFKEKAKPRGCDYFENDGTGFPLQYAV